MSEIKDAIAILRQFRQKHNPMWGIDEQIWRTTKRGKHYLIDTETQEVKKGEIGTAIISKGTGNNGKKGKWFKTPNPTTPNNNWFNPGPNWQMPWQKNKQKAKNKPNNNPNQSNLWPTTPQPKPQPKPFVPPTPPTPANLKPSDKISKVQEWELNAIKRKLKWRNSGTTNLTDYDPTLGGSMAKYVKEGKLDPKREKLHEKIVLTMLHGVKKPPFGQKPLYTFLGGGTASGKSTLAQARQYGVPQQGEAVNIDPDEIISMLPEYKAMLKQGEHNAAEHCYEEGALLARRISKVASENGFNVTLDGTGAGSLKGMLNKIDAAKQRGMRVKGVYVTVPTKEAIKRANARAQATGRYIDTDTIKDTHKRVSDILPKIASHFDEVKLYDTSGQTPKLIASGGEGQKLKPIDMNAWNQFVSKRWE